MKTLSISLIILLSFFTGFAGEGDDWGQTGHRATGEIAEEHLTKKARKQIDKLLNGKSLALVSTYGDEIKSDPNYRKYGPWHYVNLPQGETKYDPATAPEEGDLLMAMRHCVAQLKNKSTTPEDKEFYLKMLVHFIGDLHQPLHTGRGEDKGGNDIQVRWFNSGTNLHSVWDSKMIDSYNMSYTELADNSPKLTRTEKRNIASGSLEDWMMESKALSEKVYESAEIGENLSYKYMYDWFPVVTQQLQKGGIRLSTVLNDIFG